KGPSVRRACTACHTGKTRCSEVLPCQSCLKRGLGSTCAYPDPDAQQADSQSNGVLLTPGYAPPTYNTLQTGLAQQPYYEYNSQSGTLSSQYSIAGTGSARSDPTSFRPTKRPRNLTEEEAAAITRNFTRGDFYVGNSAPVRIDPRLPVRLTLGDGDHVHFTVGEQLI
ncbi:hypothetical protein FISHEDRAFT_38840, partial [Fistulina hepatica ATCC 64428]